MYKVSTSYNAKSVTDINLKVGDIITQVEDVGNGWSLGYNASSGKTGTFPTNFITKKESFRNKVKRLSMATKPQDQIKISQTVCKEDLIPREKAKIPANILHRRLTFIPGQKQLLGVKLPECIKRPVNTARHNILRSGPGEKRILKGFLGFAGGLIACGILFVLLRYSYDYSIETSGWITVGFSVPICIGMTLSTHMRCIILLMVPNLFTGKGRTVFMSIIFAKLLAGPVVNIAYNSQQASESMACAQELIYNQTQQLKRQLEEPIRRIEHTLYNGLLRVKTIAQDIKDFIQPVLNLINDFESGLEKAGNALKTAAQKCSSGIQSAKKDCEDGINGAKSACERELKKIDPTDDIINFGKDAVRTIGDGFRRVFGKKRRRRAMTEQEKAAIDLAKQLIARVQRKKQQKIIMNIIPPKQNSTTARSLINKIFLHSIGNNRNRKRSNKKTINTLKFRRETHVAFGTNFAHKNSELNSRNMSDMMIPSSSTEIPYSTGLYSWDISQTTSSLKTSLHPILNSQHSVKRIKRLSLLDKICVVLDISAICNVLELGEYVVCTPLKLFSDLIGLTTNGIKEAVSSVTKFFYFDFDGDFDLNGNINSSKSAAQIVSEVKADILSQLAKFSEAASIFGNILTLTLLILFIKSAIYLRKFLSKDRYDNFYITTSFKRYDLQCKVKLNSSILPLKRGERSKYVDTRSPFLVSKEIAHFKQGFGKVLIHLLIAAVIIVFDYTLYFVLSLIDRYGNLNINIGGNSKLDVSVDGSGFIAAFLRAFLSTIDLNSDFGVQFNLTTCIPMASKPKEENIYIFSFLYFFGFVFVVMQAYGLRLRHKIATFFYPDRDEERNKFLHEKIRHKRKSFFGWMRQHILSRNKQFHIENRITFRGWVQYKYPLCARFCSFCLPTNKKCLSCDIEYDGEVRFSVCPVCNSNYCEECFIKEMKNNCLVCDTRTKLRK